MPALNALLPACAATRQVQAPQAEQLQHLEDKQEGQVILFGPAAAWAISIS